MRSRWREWTVLGTIAAGLAWLVYSAPLSVTMALGGLIVTGVVTCGVWSLVVRGMEVYREWRDYR